MDFNHFREDPDDLWAEYGNPATSVERRVELLLKFASIEAHNNNYSKEISYLENAAEMALANGLKLPYYKACNILAARHLRIWGDCEQAIYWADKVIDAEPNLVFDAEIMGAVSLAYGRKGAALIEMGRFAEAVHVFNTQISIADLFDDGPDLAYANTGLLRAYIELDELEKAKAAGKIAKDLYQDNSRLAEMMEVDRLFAKIALIEGNLIKAKTELKEVRALEQRLFGASDVETKILLGATYLGLMNYPRAENLLRRSYDSCVKPWSLDWNHAQEAGSYLISCLAAQNNHDEAQRIALECKALARRTPGAEVTYTDELCREIDGLLQLGKPDMAAVVAENYLQQVSEAGDIKARWDALQKLFLSHWECDNFTAMVALWDSIPHEGLNYQDQMVISLKNKITHALRKVGRIQEALNLNEEVLQDIRTAQNETELRYDKENSARIHKDLKHSREARAMKDELVKEYLAIGDSQRALGLIQYFESRKRKSD